MKEVAILLSLTLLLGGCGSSSKAVQVASGSVWQSQMLGGKGSSSSGTGSSSGFSFITEFNLSSAGGLSISNFQLENQDTCFGSATLPTPSGTLAVTTNSAGQASGTFSFTITSAAGDTVMLSSSDITGTVNESTNPYTLNVGATITGTWVLTPGSATSACEDANGTFTMTETSSTT